MRLRLLPSKRPPECVDAADMEVGGIYKLVGFHDNHEQHTARRGALFIMADDKGMVCLEDGYTITNGTRQLALWASVNRPVLHFEE